jgi:hypothetical protein
MEEISEEKLMEAKKAFDALITPEILKEAEKMHKRMRRISFEELHREFTM